MSSTSTTEPSVDAESADVAEPPRRRFPLAEVATYVLAAVASTAGAAWALGLRGASIRVPFTYWGDAVATSAHVKTTLAMGWYEREPLLGVPAGQSYHDFPTADNLHLIAVRVLGLFSSDWPVVLNVYFLLGFPLAAVAAVYFLRRIGAGRTMSAVGGTLFALAPYHFLRGESHLWLASYYVVPLALLVVVRAFQGEHLWRPEPSDASRWRWARATATVVAGVTVATASTYYSVFTLVLLAVAGIAAYFQHRDVRRFLGAVAAGVLVAGVALLNMLPDVLWAQQHGHNGGGLVRSGGETEIYALKITALLMPVTDHVFGPFAHLRAVYNANYPLISEQPVLGGVAALGLVALLIIVVLRLAQRGTDRTALGWRWSTLVSLGAVTLVALLFATVGGVSSLISFLTSDLRGWNRISIMIALLSLGAVALLVDHAAGWLRARTSRVVAYSVVALTGVVLVVGGTVDQAGARSQLDFAATRAAFDADALWVGQVEDTFGADAWVFQSPYIPFPESGITNGVIETDQLKGFLHSATLGWSGGGIKGRAATDWPRAVSSQPPRAAAPLLAAAGFTALTIDRAWYGTEADAVSQQWREVAGPPVITSPGGRYEIFDLRPIRADLLSTYTEESVAAAGAAVTHPTLAYPGAGVTAGGEGGAVTWTAGESPLTLVVDNASADPAPVVITFTVLQAGGPVDVESPWSLDGPWDAGRTVRWTVDAPPGQTLVELRSAGPGPVQISEPLVTPEQTPQELLVRR